MKQIIWGLSLYLPFFFHFELLVNGWYTKFKWYLLCVFKMVHYRFTSGICHHIISQLLGMARKMQRDARENERKTRSLMKCSCSCLSFSYFVHWNFESNMEYLVGLFSITSCIASTKCLCACNFIQKRVRCTVHFWLKPSSIHLFVCLFASCIHFSPSRIHHFYIQFNWWFIFF